MKKVNFGTIILIVIIFLVGGIILGEFLNEKDMFRIFETKEEIDSNEDKETGLLGEKFIINLSGEEYIKFISDSEYEYRYEDKEDVINYTIKNGTYKYEKSIVTFDDNRIATIEDNRLIIENNNKTEDDLNVNLVYFDETSIISDFNLINTTVENHIKAMKNENSYFAQVLRVKSDIEECFISSTGKFVCSISYNVYFNKVENYSREICENENDKKFFPYTISSGACESYYARNWSFFEYKIENNNYVISSTYTGL